MKRFLIGLLIFGSVSSFANLVTEKIESSEVNISRKKSDINFQNSCSINDYHDMCRGRKIFISGCSVSCVDYHPYADCRRGFASRGAYCTPRDSECYCTK
jgi:hypothetical protein